MERIKQEYKGILTLAPNKNRILEVVALSLSPVRRDCLSITAILRNISLKKRITTFNHFVNFYKSYSRPNLGFTKRNSSVLLALTREGY